MSEWPVAIALVAVAIGAYLIYRYGLMKLFEKFARAVGRLCVLLVWGRDGRPDQNRKPSDYFAELYVEGKLTDEQLERAIDHVFKEYNDEYHLAERTTVKCPECDRYRIVATDEGIHCENCEMKIRYDDE